MIMSKKLEQFKQDAYERLDFLKPNHKLLHRPPFPEKVRKAFIETLQQNDNIAGPGYQLDLAFCTALYVRLFCLVIDDFAWNSIEGKRLNLVFSAGE